MRRCAVAVALSIVTPAAIVATAGPGAPLSPGLQAAVAALGIDAELVPPRHPAHICHPPAGGQRGILAADFDADGRVDWALLLQARIVKQRRDVGGGHVQEIRDVQRRVRLRHPGFVVVTCEKGATTWFWDTKAQAFSSLTTGD